MARDVMGKLYYFPVKKAPEWRRRAALVLFGLLMIWFLVYVVV